MATPAMAKRKIDAILLESTNVVRSIRPMNFNIVEMDVGTTSGSDSRATLDSGDLPGGINPKITFDDMGPVPLFRVSFSPSSSFIVPLQHLNNYLTSKALNLPGFEAFPATVEEFPQKITFIGFLFGSTKARHGRKDILTVSVQADQPGVMNYWPMATSGSRVGFLATMLNPQDDMFGHTLTAKVALAGAPPSILQVISYTSWVTPEIPSEFLVVPNSAELRMKAGKIINHPLGGMDNYVSFPLLKRALRLPPYLCPNVALTQIYCTI